MAGMRKAHTLSVQGSLKSSPTRLYGLEYGGELLDLGQGVYTYTEPRTDGLAAGFTPDLGAPGYAGDYHSHGASSFGRYGDEYFSSAANNHGDPGDIEGIEAAGQPGYLVTPSGRMLKYDPDRTRNPTRSIILLGLTPLSSKQ